MLEDSLSIYICFLKYRIFIVAFTKYDIRFYIMNEVLGVTMLENKFDDAERLKKN